MEPSCDIEACLTMCCPASSQPWPQMAPGTASPALPTTVPAQGPGSPLGCGVGLRGGLEQCQAPYQQLIPAWPALGLPFSETPALILTHGMFTSDSALIADRAKTILPRATAKGKHLQVLPEWAWLPFAFVRGLLVPQNGGGGSRNPRKKASASPLNYSTLGPVCEGRKC